MEARDILGLAFAALIALLVQAVAPWTGFWWLGMVAAILVALGALIDIAFRHYNITVDRTIIVMATAVTTLFVCWVYWSLALLAGTNIPRAVDRS